MQRKKPRDWKLEMCDWQRKRLPKKRDLKQKTRDQQKDAYFRKNEWEPENDLCIWIGTWSWTYGIWACMAQAEDYDSYWQCITWSGYWTAYQWFGWLDPYVWPPIEEAAVDAIFDAAVEAATDGTR